MSDIYAGDNGTILAFDVYDAAGVVNLTGASISVTVQSPTKQFVKDAVITDTTQGKCELVLKSEDIEDVGSYKIQGKVSFNNGDFFYAKISRFDVLKPL
jgi:hypothetical protein